MLRNESLELWKSVPLVSDAPMASAACPEALMMPALRSVFAAVSTVAAVMVFCNRVLTAVGFAPSAMLPPLPTVLIRTALVEPSATVEPRASMSV